MTPLSTKRLFFIGLLWGVTVVGLCGLPSVCRAQAGPVVVTALHASRPAVLGRFSTLQCTVENRGSRRVAVKALQAVMAGEGDGRAGSTVTPPNPPLAGGLGPGQRYTFRQFQQMRASGDYSCVVQAEDGQGQWRPLDFADGRPAVVSLHVVPAASIHRVAFQVSDAHAAHIYAPGQTIKLQVVPIQTGGPDLAAQVSSVQVATPARPFSMSDPATARDLLRGGSFQADFWNVPIAQKYLDITVSFAKSIALSSWSLTGENLNGQYGLKGCSADAVTPDGTTTRLPTLTSQEGSRWTALSATGRPVRASALRLRISTAYKINLTGLTVQGGPDAAPAATVTGQWQDAFGKSLSRPTPLMLFRPNTVSSPGHPAPGYEALILTTHIPGQDDARREYGFAVLPPFPSAHHDPRLGMVHMDLREPNLGVGWVKTLGTNFFDEDKFTLDVPGWQGAIADRRSRGLRELPLESDSDWASDGTRPVGQEQLRRLHDKMIQYFRSTPDVHYWELGIEENLQFRGQRAAFPDYWPNLAAKVGVVRQAAIEAHTHIKLIYQIAETDPQTVVDFCRSSAAGLFDVLSMHPYAWPDFPAPEHWMPPYMAQVHEAMAKYHAVRPVWFTEIGAPHNGNPGGFFGYPSIPAYDRGLSRREHAAYLVKCHLVALHLGVQKLFWYTYQDGGDNPEYAEDHFGMIDFWGYPKASYVAYGTMSRLLDGKPLRDTRVLNGGVQVYRFAGDREDCLVVWAYPAAAKTVSLHTLHLARERVVGVWNMFGTPVTMHDLALPVSGDPLYVRIMH